MNQPAPNQQLGLSLVELMIAATLGIVITLGVVTIYADNLQSYRIQENLSRLQENGRFAMDLLARDIRMAGGGGCSSQPFVFISTTAHPSIAGTNVGSPGSDTIVVRFAEDTGIVLDADPSAAGHIRVTGGHDLEMGDIIMLSACNGNATTVQVTNPPSGNEVPLTIFTSGATSFKKGDSVLKFSQIRYEINHPTVTGGQPALRRQQANSPSPDPYQPIVEGAENMQIRYGYTNGTTLNYTDMPPTPANVDEVTSIKIALVVASIADNITTEAVPYKIFGTTITPPDRKLRRVFTQTIAVRNRLP